MRLHAFAPLLLAALVLLVIGLIPPSPPKTRLLAGLRGMEDRTGIVPMLLGGVILYWAFRIALDAAAFRALVS